MGQRAQTSTNVSWEVTTVTQMQYARIPLEDLCANVKVASQVTEHRAQTLMNALVVTIAIATQLALTQLAATLACVM